MHYSGKHTKSYFFLINDSASREIAKYSKIRYSRVAAAPDPTSISVTAASISIRLTFANKYDYIIYTLNKIIRFGPKVIL